PLFERNQSALAALHANGRPPPHEQRQAAPHPDVQRRTDAAARETMTTELSSHVVKAQHIAAQECAQSTVEKNHPACALARLRGVRLDQSTCADQQRGKCPGGEESGLAAMQSGVE